MLTEEIRHAFQDAAIEVLRREVPEEFEWLPWSTLPRLRWQGDFAPVDPRVPRGFLVMSALRGDPEPDQTTLDRAALFGGADRALLGRWLLDVWIEHDTETPNLTAERKRELRELAERGAQLAARFGRPGTDADTRFDQLIAIERARPETSALPYRGLLAIVAACADRSIVPMVDHYLEAYHETRPETCRALIRALAFVEDPEFETILEAARRYPAFQDTAETALEARSARNAG